MWFKAVLIHDTFITFNRLCKAARQIGDGVPYLWTIVRRQPRELCLPLGVRELCLPAEAERLQPRRPLRRQPLAGLAAVELPLERPLTADSVGQRRVLGPAPRHVVVAVRRLVGHQPR
jgi:hypothetical protein